MVFDFLTISASLIVAVIGAFVVVSWCCRKS